jgi:hypothetical protein
MEKATNNRTLTGQGGVALVCFHLARRRLHYVLTDHNSPCGDIWVQTKHGKVGIEVKTTREGPYWAVLRHQIEAVDFYCFVVMATAQCFVMSSAEVTRIARASTDANPDVAFVWVREMDRSAFFAWDKLDGVPVKTGPVLVQPPSLPSRRRGFRTVRRRLADGTIKTYTYPKQVNGVEAQTCETPVT